MKIVSVVSIVAALKKRWQVALFLSFDGLALFCVIISTLMSFYLIYKHLRNYTRPSLQKYMIRIILMVPVYGWLSFLSLNFPTAGLFFDFCRNCYEAYLLYSFFMLLVAFINTFEEEVQGDPEQGVHLAVSESAFERKAQSRLLFLFSRKKPVNAGAGCYPIPTPCCPSFQPGKSSFNWIRRGILQFVIIMPLMTLIAAVLDMYPTHNHNGLYFTYCEHKVPHDGYPSHVTFGKPSCMFQRGYIYILTVENLSISIAMYVLVLFYQIVSKELSPFKPITKFLCVKLIILFAFWQQIIIGVLVWAGFIPTLTFEPFTPATVSSSLEEFIICLEMVPLALLHAYAFGYRTYRNPNKIAFLRAPHRNIGPLLHNFRDVVSQRDFIDDTLNAFKIDEAAKRTREVSEMAIGGVGKMLEREDGNTRIPENGAFQVEDAELGAMWRGDEEEQK